jgi:hypothetical protein
MSRWQRRNLARLPGRWSAKAKIKNFLEVTKMTKERIAKLVEAVDELAAKVAKEYCRGIDYEEFHRLDEISRDAIFDGCLEALRMELSIPSGYDVPDLLLLVAYEVEGRVRELL